MSKRPARRGRTARAVAGIALALWLPLAAAVAADTPAGLLQQADSIKTTDHAGFVERLHRLDADPTALGPAQQDLLQYLHGWEAAYEGDDQTSLRILHQLAAHARDPNLRLRATGSAVNVLANATRYAEAYALLDGLVAALPAVRDPPTRQRILANAATLYAEAGQIDLALSYADQMLASADSDTVACQAQYYRMLALSQRADGAFEAGYPEALARCTQANDGLYANSIRVLAAERYLDHKQPVAAAAALQRHLAAIDRIGYPALSEEVQATLARIAWAQGNGERARALALQAAKTGSNSVALIAASQVLYEIAQTKGDAADALHWYIRYADAEKGHLNDLSARALAYQQIHQQVQEKKAQLVTLRQRNQVLELQRTVDRRSRTEIELAIALLLVVLGSIGLYAWRTKRSERKFQKLAQRDGLTGILNRQHFIERARAELGYCAKSLREACLIAIDLDHFKQINDSHGHAAGDSALLAAVAACQRHLRSVDLFGRMGGEEFAILLPDTVPERAADIAEAMRAQIVALGDAPDGPGVPLSASFGIAAARVSGYELQHLLAHADGALYRAKREGRNRVVRHDPATDPGADGLPHGMADRRKTHS